MVVPAGRVLAAALLMMVMVTPATAYPSGAPSQACGDRTPQHKNKAAQPLSTVPFTITFAPAVFTTGGSDIKVTLAAKSGTSAQFKGFLLTAYFENTDTKAGSFRQATLPPNTQLFDNTCPSYTGVTHSNNIGWTTLSFDWTPPACNDHDVIFRATFVQSEVVFWVDVLAGSTLRGAGSNTPCQPSGTTLAPPVTTVPPAIGKFSKDPQCGQTKGCYSDCRADGCTFQLTWAQGTAADNVAITMKAAVDDPDGRYIAMGLSADQSMGQDSVTFCTLPANGVFSARNIGKSNTLLDNPKEGLGSIQNSHTDGVLECQFTRLIAADTSGLRFALDTPYYLLYAMGPWNTLQGSALQHDIYPSISPQAVRLVNFTVDIGGTDQTLPPGPSSTQPPSQPTKLKNDPQCGLTKGCYSDCDASGDVCTFLVTWSAGISPDTVTVTMSANVDQETGRYIALGLSEDDSMGSDSVTYCINAPEGVFLSYNVDGGTKNNELNTNPKEGLSKIDVNYNDGVLTCSFNRVKAKDASGHRFRLDKSYRLLYATGPGSDSGIEFHDRKLVSTQPASLVEFTVAMGGSVEYPLVKAHGSLMIAAWIFAASIGIVLARYFKDVWEDSTWCGQKIWFQIHRTCMVTALLATVTGFVIIFVEVGGYSQIEGEAYKKAHPILGIIVTALTIINPTMALFRPHPGAPNRRIFNWAHWMVGSGAHILGVITIFFGVLLTKAEAPDYMIYILAAYVGWQVLIQILMEIAQCMGRRNDPDEAESYEMNNIHARSQSKASPKKQATFNKRLLLFLHILVIIGFAVALIIVLVIGKDDD